MFLDFIGKVFIFITIYLMTIFINFQARKLPLL